MSKSCLASVLSSLIVFALPSVVRAGAMTLADASIVVTFPSVINNQFGYSGPRAFLSEPEMDETGDGHITTATMARVRRLQQNPLIVRLSAGPIGAATTNEGSAEASLGGSIFGNLENLTGAPLTVTFSFDINTLTKTQIDMEGADFAEASVLGTILIGDDIEFFSDTSSNDDPLSFCLGFCGGNINVTIPAHAVIPYDFDLTLEGSVESFCSDECSSPVPEPRSLLLAASGVAGLLWKRMRCARKAE